MTSLVSILIPAYNAEPYIADTLRSAMTQTWPHTEIIVVDDGSRDNTLAVARSFVSTNVKVFAQENRGAAAARNRAFAECEGDFIEFLDADDLLAPDKIEIQIKRLLDEGPDCVASCSWGRFHDDPAKTQFVDEALWRDLTPVDWLVSCWERNSMMHPAAWLVPRQVASQAGPWNETLSLDDDGEYFSRVVLSSRKVCFCRGAKTYYRSGLATSLSGSRSTTAWDSALRSLDLGTRRLLERENSPRTRRAAARSYQSLVYIAYPDAPDHIAQAESKIRQLGGSDLSAPGGPWFSFAARLFGWRAAKRIQRLLHGWRNPVIGDS